MLFGHLYFMLRHVHVYISQAGVFICKNGIVDRWESQVWKLQNQEWMTPPTLLMGITLVQPLWKTAWRFLEKLQKKKRERVIIWVSNPTPRHISRKVRSSNLKRYTHPSVYSRIIYNSQDVEATTMPINRGMDKENMANKYNEILLSHRKEWNNAICSNMDGPWDCHTEWCKTDKDKYHMILLICEI